MMFEFASAGRIVFGPGTLGQVGALARSFGERVLIVTGRRSSRGLRLKQQLDDQGLCSWIIHVESEPALDDVRHGSELARSQSCDVVLAIGGGSAIDAGKAIAGMAANEGELIEYLEVIGGGKPLPRQGLPCIAIPTTAGTGAEVTRNAVLSSPDHRLKVSLRSPHLLPRIAIIDPELTLDLPPALTAATGMDALTQLIEPYVCLRSNAITDSLCSSGIQRVAISLRRAFENGRDLEARESMCIASLFGGLSLANAGLGAVHGFAAVIGGSFKAPHGAVCGALLPHVMEMNIQALRERGDPARALERFAEVSRWLTGSAHASPEDGVRWVQELVRDLKISPLREYGIGPEHVSDTVEKASRASSMKGNPIQLTAHELQTILEKAV